ncbi:MAG: hypothetical protein JO102_03130, partial [Elusimicrobia bacterium]|nr:hypothetical protein [Elusimicrobiota bacterium]
MRRSRVPYIPVHRAARQGIATLVAAAMAAAPMAGWADGNSPAIVGSFGVDTRYYAPQTDLSRAYRDRPAQDLPRGPVVADRAPVTTESRNEYVFGGLAVNVNNNADGTQRVGTMVTRLTPEARQDLVGLILPSAMSTAGRGSYYPSDSVAAIVQLGAADLLDGNHSTPALAVVARVARVDREMGKDTAAVRIDDLATVARARALSPQQRGEARSIADHSYIVFDFSARGPVRFGGANVATESSLPGRTAPINHNPSDVVDEPLHAGAQPAGVPDTTRRGIAAETIVSNNAYIFGAGGSSPVNRWDGGVLRAGRSVQGITVEAREDLVRLVMPQAAAEARLGTYHGGRQDAMGLMIQVATKELLEGHTGTPAQALVLRAAAVDREMGRDTIATSVATLIESAPNGQLSGENRAAARALLDRGTIIFDFHGAGAPTRLVGTVLPSSMPVPVSVERTLTAERPAGEALANPAAPVAPVQNPAPAQPVAQPAQPAEPARVEPRLTAEHIRIPVPASVAPAGVTGSVSVRFHDGPTVAGILANEGGERFLVMNRAQLPAGSSLSFSVRGTEPATAAVNFDGRSDAGPRTFAGQGGLVRVQPLDGNNVGVSLPGNAGLRPTIVIFTLRNGQQSMGTLAPADANGVWRVNFGAGTSPEFLALARDPGQVREVEVQTPGKNIIGSAARPEHDAMILTRVVPPPQPAAAPAQPVGLPAVPPPPVVANAAPATPATPALPTIPGLRHDPLPRVAPPVARPDVQQLPLNVARVDIDTTRIPATRLQTEFGSGPTARSLFGTAQIMSGNRPTGLTMPVEIVRQADGSLQVRRDTSIPAPLGDISGATSLRITLTTSRTTAGLVPPTINPTTGRQETVLVVAVGPDSSGTHGSIAPAQLQAFLGRRADDVAPIDRMRADDHAGAAAMVPGAVPSAPATYFTTSARDGHAFNEHAGAAASALARTGSIEVRTGVTSLITAVGPEASGRIVRSLHEAGLSPRQIGQLAGEAAQNAPLRTLLGTEHGRDFAVNFMNNGGSAADLGRFARLPNIDAFARLARTGDANVAAARLVSHGASPEAIVRLDLLSTPARIAIIKDDVNAR